METSQKEYYLIISELRGIWLGDSAWSGINNGSGHSKAPCYSKPIGVILLQGFQQAAPDEVFSLKLIYPDIRKKSALHASEEACANIGLPRWNPSLFKETQ